MKTLIKTLLIFVAVISCKENNNILKVSTRETKKVDVISHTNLQKDIYIGKEFYAGDDLKDVEILKNSKTKIDSLSYSIYKIKSSEDYIFSLEKFLYNNDVEKYKILDTIHIKSSNEIKTEIQSENDGSELLLISSGKVLKKWYYKKSTSKNQLSKWIGNYSCNFLRMKDESADPRAWAMIYINIKKESATFQLDSYLENINKDLIILSSNMKEIILSETNNKNTKFIIKTQNEKFLLKSDLIDKTTGEISTYELKKNR